MTPSFQLHLLVVIIAAAVVFGENNNLRPAFYIGTLAIVLANFLHPLLQKRFPPEN